VLTVITMEDIMIETRNMDYYGREAFYRLVSKSVNRPILAMPQYKFKNGVISWHCYCLVDGVKTRFNGRITRNEWLNMRKSLLPTDRDLHPSGFYSF